MKCLQFNSVNVLENLLSDVHLWLIPPHRADRLHEHFPHIEWQTEAIPQSAPIPLKPWFRRPEHRCAQTRPDYRRRHSRRSNRAQTG